MQNRVDINCYMYRFYGVDNTFKRGNFKIRRSEKYEYIHDINLDSMPGPLFGLDSGIEEDSVNARRSYKVEDIAKAR